MSKTTLDDILETLVTGVEADPQHIEEEVNYTKQALLRWVADEVIGEDDKNYPYEESDLVDIEGYNKLMGGRNLLRREQIARLAQHGYKGENQ